MDIVSGIFLMRVNHKAEWVRKAVVTYHAMLLHCYWLKHQGSRLVAFGRAVNVLSLAGEVKDMNKETTASWKDKVSRSVMPNRDDRTLLDDSSD